MKIHPNIRELDQLCSVLPEELTDRFVFVGGATISFYLTIAPHDLRVSEDLDFVIPVTSLKDYYHHTEQIKSYGFVEKEDGPPCRFQKEDSSLIIDVLCVAEKILGFSNRWYKDAVVTPAIVALPSGRKIKIFSLCYALAAKMSAFENRGNGDYFGSHDFEDIVTLLEGVESLEQIKSAKKDVREFLSSHFTAYLKAEDFWQAVEGHLPRGVDPEKGRDRVLNRISQIISFGL